MSLSLFLRGRIKPLIFNIYLPFRVLAVQGVRRLLDLGCILEVKMTTFACGFDVAMTVKA